MQNKTKVVAVSYLNTKPFLYGLEQSEIAKDLEITLAIPANCAKALKENQTHIALVPVAILAQLWDKVQVIGDYCIGALGKVDTVSLFAHVPLSQIRKIYLDYQSRSSVALVQILAKAYWKIEVEFIPAQEGYENKSYAQDEAVVVIGDRAIGKNKSFAYEYDLAEHWHQWKDLPFVFAVWVATNEWLQDNKNAPDLIQQLNSALAYGLAHKKEVAKIWQPIADKSIFDLKDYYERAIQYELDAPKKEALKLFLQYLNPKAKIQFY